MKWLIWNGKESFNGFNEDGTIKTTQKHNASRFTWMDIVNKIMPQLSEEWGVDVSGS